MPSMCAARSHRFRSTHLKTHSHADKKLRASKGAGAAHTSRFVFLGRLFKAQALTKLFRQLLPPLVERTVKSTNPEPEKASTIHYMDRRRIRRIIIAKKQLVGPKRAELRRPVAIRTKKCVYLVRIPTPGNSPCSRMVYNKAAGRLF